MTSQGEFNRSQRRALQPLFSAAARQPWKALVREEAEQLARGWREGQILNTLEEFSRLSLAVACRCLLGQRLKEEPAILAGLEACLNAPHSLSLLKSIRTGLDEIADGLLRSGRGPLVEKLLSLSVSDEIRRDEVITMLLGAHETTAVTMAWCMRLLALHPDLPVDTPARAIVAEALRLYPPGWIIARQVDSRIELAGQFLEAPATVLMSPMVTHYLAEFWPQPEKFLPQRFQAERPVAGSYFPFGGGDRVCIGESLAWLEATQTVAVMARLWRLVPLDPGPVRLRPLAALRPACGLPARAVGLDNRLLASPVCLSHKAGGAPPDAWDGARRLEGRAKSCD